MRSWPARLVCIASHAAAFWTETTDWTRFSDGRDLYQFVTRPELKAPRYSVTKHSDNITPGYWFVSPFTDISGWLSTRVKQFVPCTIGPHIYDGDGELVWSGACVYDNRIVFNFRPTVINGSTFFTFYLPAAPFAAMEEDLQPSAVLMDNQYQEVGRLTGSRGFILEEHELRILDDGITFLVSVTKVDLADASMLYQQSTRQVHNHGFQEKRLGSAGALFHWDPLSAGITLNESCDMSGMFDPEEGRLWDYFHLNSVDKFANGDYLVSARHTSSIYRISKDDGHVIWRLGGCHNNSDFVAEEDVPFYWQHHARVRSENQTHIIISLLDNHSEDIDRGEPTGHAPPVGKILALDTEKMRVQVLRRFDRPDAGQSPAMGSLTLLGDDVETAPVLISWAQEGFISEYDGQSQLVLEARFVTDRERTYRAYKAAFKGEPLDSPILSILPIGHANNEVATAFYASWNGATEVAFWKFFGTTAAETTFRPLAKVERRGFETSWVMPAAIQSAFAEALDVNGEVLGRTNDANIIMNTTSRSQLGSPALRGAQGGEDPRIQRTQIKSPYRVVELFALFGLFSLLWRVIPRFCIRRKAQSMPHVKELDD